MVFCVVSARRLVSRPPHNPEVPAGLDPARSTLLLLRHGFMAPGGRFREAYYWDTHWTVLGLLACGMTRTATHAIPTQLTAGATWLETVFTLPAA